MLRLRFLFVGVSLLLLCLVDLGHAAQENGPIVVSPETADTAPLKTIDGLRKGALTPAQTPIPRGVPLTILPRSWPTLVIAAGPYARFLNTVQLATRIPPKSAEDLERVMGDLASFDGPKLSRAFHAHAILRAMQTPAFFTGIEKWGNTYDRKGIITNIHINPAYVEQMPGYHQAREQILKAIKEDGQATLLAGSIYKDHAYTLQRLKWALKVRGGKALRMAALRNAPYAPRGTPVHLLQSLMSAYDPIPSMTLVNSADSLALAGLSSTTGLLAGMVRTIGPGAAMATSPSPATFALPVPTIAPSRQGQLQDILASAALHILDPAAPYPSVLPPRNTPDFLAECVDWARLHLNQCVAATRYVYEDSFCIARHQLKDTGQCIAAFTGAAQPATH